MRERHHLLLDPVSMKLSGPNGEREQTIESVTIRPPKGRDMRAIDGEKGPIAGQLAMISRLSGQPINVVDEMSARDIAAISEIVDAFIEPGRPTGEISPAT